MTVPKLLLQDIFGGGVKTTIHPCAYIDPYKICGKKRILSSDSSFTEVLGYVYGEGMKSVFGRNFYNKNKDTIDKVDVIRGRSRFGGEDESQVQK